MNETPYKIIFWINETKIYATTWRSRLCRLDRLARLNTSARRYISWRQIWYICLTVVIFWVCLRFRNVEMKDLRKMGICIQKNTACHWTFYALQDWKRYFRWICFCLEIGLLFRFWGVLNMHTFVCK